jgi:pilus assembly protein CpaB
MRPRTVIVLVVAVGCGLAAALMVKNMLGAQTPVPFVPNDTVDVLVAKQKISAWTLLNDPKFFDKKTMAKQEANKDYIAAGDFEKRVKGRTTRMDLEVGSPLAESDLTESLATIELKLKPGERAFTIKTNADFAVAGLIFPGDKVDITATVSSGSERYAETILEDIEVLALNTELDKPKESSSARPAERVTLRLTTDQVPMVAIYADTGNLRLSKRHPGDPGGSARGRVAIGQSYKGNRQGPRGNEPAPAASETSTGVFPSAPAPKEKKEEPVVKPPPEFFERTIIVGDRQPVTEKFRMEPSGAKPDKAKPAHDKSEKEAPDKDKGDPEKTDEDK